MSPQSCHQRSQFVTFNTLFHASFPKSRTHQRMAVEWSISLFQCRAKVYAPWSSYQHPAVLSL